MVSFPRIFHYFSVVLSRARDLNSPAWIFSLFHDLLSLACLPGCLTHSLHRGVAAAADNETSYGDHCHCTDNEREAETAEVSMFARGAKLLKKRVVFAPATGITGRSGCPHHLVAGPPPVSSRASSSIRSYSSAKNEEVDDDLAAVAPPQVTLTTQTAAAATTSTRRPRKRHRHRFRTTEEIPSFHEFQLQQRVRSLYRQFTRLVLTQQQSARRDLQNQIRREFRLPQQDQWHVKRSVSEGNRRFKELSAMLGSSLVPPSGGGDRDGSKHASADDPSSPLQESETAFTATTTTTPPSSKTGNWPWNNDTSTSGTGSGGRRGPMPFPPKSNV